MESEIYPLAIYLEDPEAVFNREFFYNTPNQLAKYLPEEASWGDSVRLIRVASFRPNHHLKLVMDDEAGLSVAYLERTERDRAG